MEPLEPQLVFLDTVLFTGQEYDTPMYAIIEIESGQNKVVKKRNTMIACKWTLDTRTCNNLHLLNMSFKIRTTLMHYQ